MSFDINAIGGYGSGRGGSVTVSSAQTFGASNFAYGFPTAATNRSASTSSESPEITKAWKIANARQDAFWRTILLIQIGTRTKDADEEEWITSEGDITTAPSGKKYGYLSTNDRYFHYTYDSDNDQCHYDKDDLTTDAGIGKWEVREIFYAGNSEWIFNKEPTLDAANYIIMGVYFNEYENLTLNAGGSMQPAAFNSTDFYGGVLAIKVSDTLTFNGGHIKTAELGAPNDFKPYRKWTPQEYEGLFDTDIYSGCENSIAKNYFPINIGDGNAFIVAKNIVVTDSSSRIGNPSSAGVQYCRNEGTHVNPTCVEAIQEFYKPNSSYAIDDLTGTTKMAYVGGSNILIACQNFTGFTPSIISKYRSVVDYRSGRGLARAYIALGNINDKILADEGLYALDAIKSATRLNSFANVKNFGHGSDGNATNVSSCIDCTAVSSVSDDYKTFTCSRANVGCSVGRLVLVHQMQKSAGQDVNSGKFYLARVTAVSTKVVTLDTPCNLDPNNYFVQLISLKEYNNLTISDTVRGEFWDGTGGILPIVCNGTLDLRGGFLDVRGCGTKSNISNTLVGNNFMRSRLYIGQGHGTVFILAREILMNANTRIGADYSGANFGDQSAVVYCGAMCCNEGGYAGAYNGDAGYHGGGWGGNGDEISEWDRTSQSYKTTVVGGWHGNAPDWEDLPSPAGLQGAHILIVSNSIDGFNLHAISTGGNGKASDYDSEENFEGNEDFDPNNVVGTAGHGGGGAGYGGTTHYGRPNFAAGGYRGGGANGGSSGACFIYANNITNQDTTGIITA